MRLRVKFRRGINDLGNAKLKAIANEQSTLMPIMMCTHSLKIK